MMIHTQGFDPAQVTEALVKSGDLA